ncbi:hypothetical protein ABIF78_007707 [Bradyrhizobium japonicum]
MVGSTALEPDRQQRRPGTFAPGFDPRRDASQIPPRRKPGTPNAITRDLKRGIIDAAERYGSDGKGKDGLTGYLFHLAGKHPKAFAGLLGKILPMQVSGNVGQFIGTVNVISVPADNYLSADDITRLTAPLIDQEQESQGIPSAEGDAMSDPE